MTRQEKAERQEALEELREIIKPGDTVHTILRHVSRSGMQRIIDPLVIKDGEHRYIRWQASQLIGAKMDRDRDGLKIGGCGMDMGFHLVYSLSHALYGDGYQCLGESGKCPSNYHVNHRSRVRCEGIDGHFCYRPDPFGRWPIAEDWPKRTIEVDGESIPAGYLACIEWEAGTIPVGTKDLIMREDGSALQVCPTCGGDGDVPNPEGPERWDLVHKDGYALRQRWL